MKIFIGTQEIAAQIGVYAAGFRRLGHDVTTGVYRGHFYKFDQSLKYDVIVRPNDMRQIEKIIESYDVFMFQYGTSLLGNNNDYKLIKQAGKKIISLFNGSDIRYWPAYEQLFGVDYAAITGEQTIPAWRPDSIDRVLQKLRYGELYADLVLSVPNQSVLGIRPYNHFFYPMQPERYKFAVPGREIPLVVHAPSNTATKGTANILRALDALRAEGVRFDLQLLQDVNHAQVLEALMNADCVIDQALLGYGLFAAEGMASGCAAATAHFPELEAFAGLRPVQGLRPDTLQDDLRSLLTDRELRLRLATQGREHVETYHDVTRICQRMLDDLFAGESRVWDYWPTFYARGFVLPKGIGISDDGLDLTSRIAGQWGLPPDASVESMTARGLLPVSALGEAYPRWKTTPLDASRYGAPAIKSVSALPPFPTPDFAWKKLRAQQALRLFPVTSFSTEIHAALRSALRAGDVLRAMALLLDDVKSNTARKEMSLGALGLLLYGRGQYAQSLELLGHLPAVQEKPLVRWLVGLHRLASGNVAQALPLVHELLDGMSSSKGHITLGRADGLAACAIDWRPPADPNQAWCSPAMLTPDWCRDGNEDAQWAAIAWQCLEQGYGVRLGEGAFPGWSPKARRTLGALLEAAGALAASYPASVEKGR